MYLYLNCFVACCLAARRLMTCCWLIAGCRPTFKAPLLPLLMPCVPSLHFFLIRQSLLLLHNLQHPLRHIKSLFSMRVHPSPDLYVRLTTLIAPRIAAAASFYISIFSFHATCTFQNFIPAILAFSPIHIFVQFVIQIKPLGK